MHFHLKYISVVFVGCCLLQVTLLYKSSVYFSARLITDWSQPLEVTASTYQISPTEKSFGGSCRIIWILVNSFNWKPQAFRLFTPNFSLTSSGVKWGFLHRYQGSNEAPVVGLTHSQVALCHKIKALAKNHFTKWLCNLTHNIMGWKTPLLLGNVLKV